MRNPTKCNRRRGMTTMEMALILPFIFILVMGMIEMGNMFSAWMTIQKAAQTGARVASTGVGDEEGSRMSLIIAETEKWMESLGGDKLIEIKSWPSPSAGGEGITGSAGGPCELVEVGVTYDYHPVTPILSSLFPDVILLTGHDRKLNEPWKPCDG